MEKFLKEFKMGTLEKQNEMLKEIKNHSSKVNLSKRERKALGMVYRQKLVKRSHLPKIAAAWVINVPVSGLMVAILFYTIHGMMLI